MPYSRECMTFWCDECGKECVVDWKASNEDVLVLACTNEDCHFSRSYSLVPTGKEGESDERLA
jgi:hypothetical protein